MGVMQDLLDKIPFVSELKKAAGNYMSSDPNETVATKLYKAVGPSKGPVTTDNSYVKAAAAEAQRRAIERGQIKGVKPMDALAGPTMMPKKKSK